jgi:glucose-6-phosphate 1-epimerase
MPPPSIEQLAREFAVAGARWETGSGALPFLVVDTDHCRARLTPYGGQLCDWTPAGQAHPVLFMSPRSAFAAGKAIRGGVPVCFPWFGNHASGDKTKPAHGFARTRLWDVVRVARDAAGDVLVDLRLSADDATRAHWSADFEAHLRLSLGRTLGMTFEVTNRGAAAITYEIALHSYVTVGDVEQIRVRGLERTRFVDKVDGGKEHVQGNEPLAFTGETDRVFLDTDATCTIDDAVLARRIRVAKSGSLATVVWNPGRAKGEAMADVGGDAWRGFVCVETAQCGIHEVRLAPGARHAMAARVDVELLTA